MMSTLSQIFLALLVCFYTTAGFAQEEEKKTNGKWTKEVKDRNIKFGQKAKERSATAALSAMKKISNDVQVLKQDVIGLNKDLRLLEEQLLFPSSTKFSVFLSMDTGQFFTLESVKLKVDGKLVSTHLYSDRQREALARGGIQKLYITNMAEGRHSVTAFFTGLGPNGRAYKRAKELVVKKGPGSTYLEIAVTDDGNIQEPVFKMKQW